jgi:hypothetical protein
MHRHLAFFLFKVKIKVRLSKLVGANLVDHVALYKRASSNVDLLFRMSKNNNIANTVWTVLFNHQVNLRHVIAKSQHRIRVCKEEFEIIACGGSKNCYSGTTMQKKPFYRYLRTRRGPKQKPDGVFYYCLDCIPKYGRQNGPFMASSPAGQNISGNICT